MLRILVLLLFGSVLSVVKGQDFELPAFDKDSVISLRNSGNPIESDLFIYLNLNFQITTAKESVKKNPFDQQKDCSFKQGFEHEITYYVSACEIPEGVGFEEIMTFPKTDLEIVQKFITDLHSDSDNTWTSPYEYSADGAGCYYHIKETNQQTVIEIWCGC